MVRTAGKDTANGGAQQEEVESTRGLRTELVIRRVIRSMTSRPASAEF